MTDEKKTFAFNVEATITTSIFGVPFAKSAKANIKTVEFTDEELTTITSLLTELKQLAKRDFEDINTANALVLPTVEDVAKLVGFFGFTVQSACNLIKQGYTNIVNISKVTSA
jgi:nitric oxide reductase large subunit